MAKQSMIQREIRRTKLVKKFIEQRQKIKKEITKQSNFSEKLQIQKKLQQLPRNSSRCRQRNRCWLTGRSRGFYRTFGISRHVLREMGHNCLLPGVTKSSW